jgi:hypothetical protein
MPVEKVALVTAAGRGMGAEIARELARSGYRVALLSPSERSVALADEIGGLGIQGSVTEPADLERLVAAALDRLRSKASYSTLPAFLLGEQFTLPELKAVYEKAMGTPLNDSAFRRKLMDKSPKHLAVLNAVAERVGWDKPAPAGVYRGLAHTMGFGSYVAACAEVSVDAEGKLKVHRIVAATDSGHAVNPQQIQAQVEGSFVYGLSAALFGGCTVKDGRIEQQNFDTYPVVHMEDMPKVETIVMPSGGFWGGVGEPTIAVAAPAVMNAIFAATGKRIRDMPLKNHSLKKA